MTWWIGPIGSETVYSYAPDCAIRAGDVAVTDARGWIDVRTDPEVRERGAPAAIAVRLVLGPGPGGRLSLFVEDVVVGARRFRSIREVDAPWAPDWRATLADRVRDEFVRRVAEARRQTGTRLRVPTPPTPAARARGEPGNR